MFRLEGVSFAYGSGQDNEVGALAGIDLAIDKGEFIVVVGHNGSGKSTLAKHLNALLIPTSGRVLVKDMDTRDPKNLWKIRQIVGMVFQNPDNQIVATTVEEDVAFGPENLGVPPAEIRERVDWALEVVDMVDYKRHAPHLLSGGQKQRVAIAGVLAMRPESIVLDEPTAMLDPAGREEVMRTICKLNSERGMTVVHITHFMNEAVLGSRVVVMEGGSIVMDDTPAKIFSQVETIRGLHLDVPQVTELAYELNKAGARLPQDIFKVSDMAIYVDEMYGPRRVAASGDV
ncbi:MAG: energy-coupling factor transporter ATPase [Firmicutes bacterium]|nr:energy-coupling factor transporter ATPase [Bacillota bacterium]